MLDEGNDVRVTFSSLADVVVNYQRAHFFKKEILIIIGTFVFICNAIFVAISKLRYKCYQKTPMKCRKFLQIIHGLFFGSCGSC